MNVLAMIKQRGNEDTTQDLRKIESMITSDAEVMDGLPVFAGTRIPVYIVLDYLAQGSTTDQILQDYPALDEQKIRGALKFAEILASLH